MKINKNLKDINDQFNLLEVVFVEAHSSEILKKYWLEKRVTSWPWSSKEYHVVGDFLRPTLVEEFEKDNFFYKIEDGKVVAYPYLQIHFKSKLKVEYAFDTDAQVYRALNDLNKLLNNHQKWLQI